MLELGNGPNRSGTGIVRSGVQFRNDLIVNLAIENPHSQLLHDLALITLRCEDIEKIGRAHV